MTRALLRNFFTRHHFPPPLLDSLRAHHVMWLLSKQLITYIIPSPLQTSLCISYPDPSKPPRVYHTLTPPNLPVYIIPSPLQTSLCISYPHPSKPSCVYHTLTPPNLPVYIIPSPLQTSPCISHPLPSKPPCVYHTLTPPNLPVYIISSPLLQTPGHHQWTQWTQEWSFPTLTSAGTMT